jgi:Ran GTPase-activating protein (RanGAP) involved in mRNA processing and transport
MNTIKDIGANVIANALRVNSSLTTLDLENNHIGNDGLIALANPLKLNSRLLSLILDCNMIGNSGVIAIAKEMRCNICLSKIGLGQCGIEYDDNVLIADALRFNPTILDLNN